MQNEIEKEIQSEIQNMQKKLYIYNKKTYDSLWKRNIRFLN